MLAAVRDIYRQSKKKRDNFWTEWISRPPAALLVYLLEGTRVTPNQVSFFAIAVVIPAVLALRGLIRDRHADGLSIYMTTMLLLSLVISFISGSVRFLLETADLNTVLKPLASRAGGEVVTATY